MSSLTRLDMKTFNGHTNWLYGHNKSTRQPATAVPEAASQEPGLTAVTTLPVQGHPVPFFQTKQAPAHDGIKIQMNLNQQKHREINNKSKCL